MATICNKLATWPRPIGRPRPTLSTWLATKIKRPSQFLAAMASSDYIHEAAIFVRLTSSFFGFCQRGEALDEPCGGGERQETRSSRACCGPVLWRSCRLTRSEGTRLNSSHLGISY